MINHRAASVSKLASAVLGLAMTALPARAQSPLPHFDPPLARAALAVLAEAPSHGLEARDYGLPALARALDATDAGSGADSPSDRSLDRALHAALLRYLHDLHDGRVTPAQLGQRFAMAPSSPPTPFDAEATLRAALALRDPALAVRAAAPPLAQYERLRKALARYRVLATDEAWRVPLPARPGERALEPGASWAGASPLAKRLSALGDLPASVPLPTRYEGTLVEAVRAFQRRHGLADDGVIGRGTWAALQVSPAQRVRQLELALERLRLTPLLQAPRMVLLNIPEFVLRAYEVQGDSVVVRLESRVIVGNALDTRTPLIGEAMRRIEFQPYWNVPASIARRELVPRLQREPAFWAREGFEFVAAGGGPADAVFAADKLQAVLDGRLRIRQRPGPRNPLGDIKFVFPNHESIYLHDTPSTPLFAQARRDFSHGCIRVEQPVALARFALNDPVRWTEPHIEDAMRRGEPAGVALAQPLPVLIAYGTALVKGGRVHFFEDLYGHDRTLDAALRALARPPITVQVPLQAAPRAARTLPIDCAQGCRRQPRPESVQS